MAKNMSSVKISKFMEEIGNHYLKIPFKAEWTGLNRRTFNKKKEIWPMIFFNGLAMAMCGAYLARLLSYKDLELNRGKPDTWKSPKIDDRVNMATWVDLKKVKFLHKSRPNIDE